MATQTRMRLFTVLSALAVLASRILLAQSPAVSQAPAAVDGFVVSLGTSQPMSGVRVYLSPDIPRGAGGPPTEPGNEPQWYSATTNQDGRFAFENVKPGRYRMAAARDGYLPAEYGQRAPTAPGAGFVLEPGQRLRSAAMAIAPTGSIAGRIYDRDGPAGRVQVQALRPRYRDGRPVLTIVQSVLSNDRGEYRLFWLAPGQYYVAARPVADGPLGAVAIQQPSRAGGFEEARAPVISSRTLPTGEVLEETVLPVYYPGTIALDAAARIDLKSGMAADGLDIALNAGAMVTRHLRGVAINAVNGQPSAGTRVMAVPRTADPSVMLPSATATADGTFDIKGLVPGDYYVFAENREFSTGLSLQVGEADINNLTLALVPSFLVPGRFVIDGRLRDGSNPNLSLMRLDLRREPDVVGMPSSGPTFSPPPAADGSFTLQGVAAGDFRVSVRAVPPDGYVRSIHLGSTNVLDSGLRLSGKPRDILEVVVVMNGGRVTGTVVDARQEPVSNAIVALVPDSDRHRADLYRRATTDSAGRFTLRGVAAGTYRAFAWEVVDEGAWQDPAFMRGHESRGAAVRVRDGNDEAIQITVIR